MLEVRERQPGAGRSGLGWVTSLGVEVSCLCTPPAAGKGRPAPGDAPTMTGALQVLAQLPQGRVRAHHCL